MTDAQQQFELHHEAHFPTPARLGTLNAVENLAELLQDYFLAGYAAGQANGNAVLRCVAQTYCLHTCPLTGPHEATCQDVSAYLNVQEP